MRITHQYNNLEKAIAFMKLTNWKWSIFGGSIPTEEDLEKLGLKMFERGQKLGIRMQRTVGLQVEMSKDGKSAKVSLVMSLFSIDEDDVVEELKEGEIEDSSLSTSLSTN